MVKPTKWLEPAKYGRPREGPPDGGDEWQPSRFWAYDDGTFIDDLEGAQDVEFVVEPDAVREQENELVLKVTWFDPRDGEDCEDWMPYEHVKPDFGRELKQLERKLNPTFFGPERDLLMKYKDIETDEQSSSGEEDTAAPAPAPKTQDERADFDGPYGSDDDSDDDIHCLPARVGGAAFIAFRDERTLHTELQRGFLDAVVLLGRLHLARLTVASADYFGHVIEVARFLSVICLRLALVPSRAVRCTIQLALAIPTA